MGDKSRQFLWIPVETYIFRGDLPLDYIYYRVDSIESFEGATLSVCWRTERIFDTFTYSTKNLTETKIKNYPLHYVNTETKRLSERYSLLVNQYSITENAYKYWDEIKKQNAESSSLYTRQPFQIRGNLTNIDNPDDMILGYFMAAGVSRKRIFVNRPQLYFRYLVCKASAEGFREMFKPPTIFPKYVSIISGDDGGTDLGTAPLSCFDCQLQGGTLIKPDFWED